MKGFSKIEKLDKEEYYYSPEGYVVFTEKYHLKRGYCCQRNCKHCTFKKEFKRLPFTLSCTFLIMSYE